LGLFARGVKSEIYRKDPSLPAEMRYFGGNPPQIFEAARLAGRKFHSPPAKGLKWRPEYLSSLASPHFPARWS